MKAHYFIFEVRGSGEFPVDMLRYDSCHPVREEDSSRMGYWQQERTVRLVRGPYRAKGDAMNVTPDRWQSFTWRVLRHPIDYTVAEASELPFDFGHYTRDF